jgi:pyrrolidone-carboxylate peptidase
MCDDLLSRLVRQAYNEASFRVPDERGNTPIGVEIVEADEAIRCTRIDVNALLEYMCSLSSTSSTTCQLTDDDMRISADPGRFVCNYIYFKSLNAQAVANETYRQQHAPASKAARPRDSLFVHVPPFEAISEDQQMTFVLAMLVRLVTQGTKAMQDVSPSPLAVPGKSASSFYDAKESNTQEDKSPVQDVADAIGSMMDQLEAMGFPREL